MEKYYIGWDVGAWHCKKGSKSKDAFAILDENRNLIGNLWETNGGTDLKSIILKTVKEEAERTSIFIEEIFSLCGAKAEYKKDASFCIAIDTPLGWTTSFRELLTMWSSNENEDFTLGTMGSKNNNPILTRETEKRFDKSLSVIQDQIGSQSTKAMYLLSLLKPHKLNTGVWKTKYPNLLIIETYPAPCMRSLAFIEHMKSIDLKANTISSSDKFDALVCANLAWCFENPPSENPKSVQIDSPPAGIDPAEGWIFAPKENILDSNFGVSYSKLIGTKGLSELLSEIQIAIVLSAKEKDEKKKKKEIRFTSQLEVVTDWASRNNNIFKSFPTDYGIPRSERSEWLSARVEELESAKNEAKSDTQRNKQQKKQNVFKKQQRELKTFDEKLNNYLKSL